MKLPKVRSFSRFPGCCGAFFATGLTPEVLKSLLKARKGGWIMLFQWPKGRPPIPGVAMVHVVGHWWAGWPKVRKWGSVISNPLTYVPYMTPAGLSVVHDLGLADYIRTACQRAKPPILAISAAYQDPMASDLLGSLNFKRVVTWIRTPLDRGRDLTLWLQEKARKPRP